MFELGEIVVYRGVTAKIVAKTYDSECLYDLLDSYGVTTTYVPESDIRAATNENSTLS